MFFYILLVWFSLVKIIVGGPPLCECKPLSKNFDENITGKITSPCRLCYSLTYDFHPNQTWAPQICAKSSDAIVEAPILIAVRQSYSIKSIRIPLIFDEDNSTYDEVCHTLCPIGNYIESKSPNTKQIISVELSTISETPIHFSFSITQLQNFVIGQENSTYLSLLPSTPRVLQYNMDADLDAVRIEVNSNDSSCALLAIQDISCPFYDTARTIEYKGFYQRFTKQSGITIKRKNFPEAQVYIVLFLKPNDEECTRQRTDGKAENFRQKEIAINIVPMITDKDFNIVVFGTLGIYIGVSIILFILYAIFFSRQMSVNSPYSVNQEENENLNRNCIQSCFLSIHRCFRCFLISILCNQKEVKDDQEGVVYVSELAKDSRFQRTSYIYSWNTITIALFYGIPVFQLVYLNQKIITITGNQDICFYNFLCSYHWWISDFNHFFSNVGYVIFGLFFIALVFYKEYLHSMQAIYNVSMPRQLKHNDGWFSNIRRTLFREKVVDSMQELDYGIPPHYGLLYAMGWALVIEGGMSACYHVCPNKANYQFDTAFMYVIATLCMLKLYHARHRDITVESHVTWFCLAIVMIICILGVIFGNLLWRIILIILHMIFCFLISTSVYYRGWNAFDNFPEFAAAIKDGFCHPCTHIYPIRFKLLCFAVFMNLIIDIVCLIILPDDFATSMLIVFLVNIGFYIAYYIAMKIIYEEKYFIPFVHFIIAGIFWITAIIFFFIRDSAWEKTPALSRVDNKHCHSFNFYDEHDIWHLLSSIALFFTYMTLLIMDDDLNNKKQTEIRVC